MDMTPTNTNTPTAKSPETESTDQTAAAATAATRIQPATTKTLPLSNGVLKRHQPHHHLHHHHHHHNPGVVTYKECLKNHAASLGGHALDGCGEFMPSPSATPTDPTSLKCAACGCHRNFHRREPEDNPLATTASNANATATIEYQPHHRHHPPPPPPPSQQPHRSPNSASPPPISSAYYPSAPHMLLALSGNLQAHHHHQQHPPADNNNNHHIINAANINLSSSARKRFRTKFSQTQKDKMFEFAERVGWKMQKRDEELIQDFCHQIGVDRTVLKVWMHNNKNTFGKRDNPHGSSNNGGGLRINLDENNNREENNNINNNGDDEDEDDDDDEGTEGHGHGHGHHVHNLNHNFGSDSMVNAATTNGSSSSSR